MICPQCNNDVLFFPSGVKVCVKCAESNAKKADKKPVKKRFDDRYSKREQEQRKKARLKYSRKRNKTIMGRFVVFHDGKWKSSVRNPLWDTFSLAKVFKSKGLAQMSATNSGKGVVMERMETEKETLDNHRRELMRII